MKQTYEKNWDCFFDHSASAAAVVAAGDGLCSGPSSYHCPRLSGSDSIHSHPQEF